MGQVSGTNGIDIITIYKDKVTIDDKDYAVAKSGSNTILGLGNYDEITVNGGNRNKIYGGKDNDTIIVNSTIGASNRIFGDDAKGTASGEDTFKIYGGKNNYYYGGRGDDTVYIKGVSGNTVYGGTGKDTIFIQGGSKNNKIYGNGGIDTIYIKNGKNNKIYGDAGNDRIYIKGNRNKIFGGNANDKVYINAGSKNTINGGKGADTIYISGGSKNTVYGSKGKDTFVVNLKSKQKFSATIKDYKTGEDTLKVAHGTLTSMKPGGKGKDIIFNCGKGTVTLAKALGKTVSLTDARGSYTASKTEIKLGKDFKGTMDAAKFLSTVTTLDGRDARQAVSITGNANDNIIYAGKAGGVYKGYGGKDTLHGGAGKDTLYGGADDDKLYGDAGNDTLYGGAGDDYLYGGSGEDKLYAGAGNNHLYGGNEGETVGVGTGNNFGDINIPIGDMTQDSFYFGSESTGTNIIYDFKAGTGEMSDLVFLKDGVEIFGSLCNDGSDGLMRLCKDETVLGTVLFKGCANQTVMVNNEAKTFANSVG